MKLEARKAAVREERPSPFVRWSSPPSQMKELSDLQLSGPQAPAWKDLLSEFTWLEPRCSINLAEFHEP